MLRIRTLDSMPCASCGGYLSLIQVNGCSVQVETASACVGDSLLVFEIHRCNPTPIKPTGDSRRPPEKRWF